MEPARPVWGSTRNSTGSPLMPYFSVQSSQRALVTQIQEDGEINANPWWGHGKVTLQDTCRMTDYLYGHLGKL